MAELYEEMLPNDDFKRILKEFDLRFNSPISQIKKVDFILWAYGSTL